MRRDLFNSIFIAILVFSLFSLISCDSVEPGTGEGVNISHFTTENFPEIDGSTSKHRLCTLYKINLYVK